MCAEYDYIAVKVPTKSQGFKDTVMAAAKSTELSIKGSCIILQDN